MVTISTPTLYSSWTSSPVRELVGLIVQARYVEVEDNSVIYRILPLKTLDASSTRTNICVLVSPRVVVELLRDVFLVAVTSTSHDEPVKPVSTPYGDGVHLGTRGTRYVYTRSNGGRKASQDRPEGTSGAHSRCSVLRGGGAEREGVC